MLRHSSDSEPGFTRQRKSRAWAYFDGGKRVADRDEIDRLNSLALPPGYTDAWFCKDANGRGRVKRAVVGEPQSISGGAWSPRR